MVTVIYMQVDPKDLELREGEKKEVFVGLNNSKDEGINDIKVRISGAGFKEEIKASQGGSPRSSGRAIFELSSEKFEGKGDYELVVECIDLSEDYVAPGSWALFVEVK